MVVPAKPSLWQTSLPSSAEELSPRDAFDELVYVQ
jgi:hypothetical protein